MATPGRGETFDVICAGEPLWTAAVRPVAGIFTIAGMLVRRGARVGLATVLDDDRFGRMALAEMAALGIDVAGVTLASSVTEVVLVDAAGGQSVVSERHPGRDLEVPAPWSSQVLLLSGLSPMTSRMAAFCKIARKARKMCTTVVLDLAAGLRQWGGRDPRTISMLLREVDVVRCSLVDMAVLGIDAASIRRALRSGATLVVNDVAATTATGAFGEVCIPTRLDPLALKAAGEACTAAICAELASPSDAGHAAASAAGRWHHVLRGWVSTQTLRL